MEPCNPNPCLNDGVCEDKDGLPLCICKFPFVGARCNGMFIFILLIFPINIHEDGKQRTCINLTETQMKRIDIY